MVAVVGNIFWWNVRTISPGNHDKNQEQTRVDSRNHRVAHHFMDDFFRVPAAGIIHA